MSSQEIQRSPTLQLSVLLPRSTQTRIHIHLTAYSKAIMLFLTTTGPSEGDDPSGLATLGSFVYALPSVRCYIPSDPSNNTQPSLSTPLCTNIYVRETSIEFTRRMAIILTRKLSLPVYVGNSMSFDSAGLGGSVEEEIEGFKKVVEVVTSEVHRLRST
jgi:hypothetical protein